jgi:maltooligosyltrehalose trehalohydrolase
MASDVRKAKLGANFTGPQSSEFLVWAPFAKRVDLCVEAGAGPERSQLHAMQREEDGYFFLSQHSATDSMEYFYVLDGEKTRADPASRYQPRGVHGASRVAQCNFEWDDSNWKGLPLAALVFYEIHVGTFTPSGTFDAIPFLLRDLKSLGVNMIELMPVAQYPGTRNWGYDGVYPYAVQNSYGGPPALKRLVNACHREGVGVTLDVVYNHLGPEGNCLRDFGPYFTDRYKTPWGEALNFDGPSSDEVRRFFIENALYWISEFHIDALRLDAVHAIVDDSAQPFVAELAASVHQLARELGRNVQVIAETDRNDARIVACRQAGGDGLDAQWNDDFHHALHALLTAEKAGYYQDFGSLEDMGRAYREGYVYAGQYSEFRKRRHGNSPREILSEQLIVFGQNHDQIGNRARGERLNALVSYEQAKLAAGVLLLSPFVPLLFMGQEYGEPSPFQYFVSHENPDLIRAVREGRRSEFKSFGWQGDIPDPQSEDTFARSKLSWHLRERGKHQVLLRLYKELLRLRRTVPALANLDRKASTVCTSEPHREPRMMTVERWLGESRTFAAFNFDAAPGKASLPADRSPWQLQLDSADPQWGGAASMAPRLVEKNSSGSVEVAGHSFCLYSAGQGAHRE